MQIKMYNFEQHGDERGMLVSLETYKNVPFEIKRIYYIYGTKEGVHRGFHSHKSLKQILVCVNGLCTVLLDDGKEKKTVILDKPYQGLFVPENTWREMYDFSEDAVLLVLASEYYCEDDYIRNYEEFIQTVEQIQQDI